MHAVRRVLDPDLLVQGRASGTQGHAYGPPGAEDLLLVGDLQVSRTVRIAAGQRVHGRNDRDRVAVGAEIPLDSAADPCAPHGDHAGFDHATGMEHLFVGRLVKHRMQTAAQFRQAGHAQVLVLQIQRPIGAIGLGPGQVVLHDVRIGDRSVDGRRQLDAALQGPELGVNVFLPAVGRDRQLALPGTHLGPALPCSEQRGTADRHGNDGRSHD